MLVLQFIYVCCNVEKHFKHVEKHGNPGGGALT